MVTQAVKVMSSSREKAQATVHESSKAGLSLESITEMVSRISDMNAQIASAAEEQSAVAEEVNRNIVAISQVSEETAINSSQLTTAGEDVAKLALHLHGLVAKFKI